MAFFSSFYFCILFYAFIIICSVSSSKNVPVLMWGSTDKNDRPPALTPLSNDDFKEILSSKLRDSTSFLIFNEESLSPEDIKSEIYPRTSNFRNKDLTYYTSVEDPSKVLYELRKNIVEIDINEAKKIKIKPGQTVIVRLNDAGDLESRKEMLQRHDNIIFTIAKEISQNNEDVIIMYTGFKASFEQANEKYSRQRRDTNEPEQSDKGLITYSQYLAMYASSSSKLIQSTKNESKEYNLIECPNSNNYTDNRADISFCLKDQDAGLKVTFSIENTTSNYWLLKSVSIPKVSSNPSTNGSLINNLMSKVYAPKRFSYHCGNLTLTSAAKDGNETIVSTLILIDFQLERFFIELNKTNLSFDSAYDCVGFTSGPIWSGIFVTFILALIMTFGLCMIMDIKTMDRFDDPKGKTISINVSE